MKRTPLKRKTPLKSYSGFTSKPIVKQRETGLRRTKLRLVGQSSKTELKNEIQAILRAIVILRDGGCFLRHYSKNIESNYVSCSGKRKDGDLILQAEHLHTRGNASSFSDSRLVVCVCQRHHIYYKPQFTVSYNELAKTYIGEKRSKLWEAVRLDRSPHKVDLKLEKLALEQELKKLIKEYPQTKIKFQENTKTVVDEIMNNYKYL